MLRVILTALAVCIVVPANAATYRFDATLTNFYFDSIMLLSNGTHHQQYQPGLSHKDAAYYAGGPVGTVLHGTVQTQGAFRKGVPVTCNIAKINCRGIVFAGASNKVFGVGGGNYEFWFDMAAGTIRYRDDASGIGNDPRLGQYLWDGTVATWTLSNITVIPLPATMPLFAAALLSFGYIRRRKPTTGRDT